MKKRVFSLFGLVLFAACLLSLTIPVSATTQASDYFSATDVWATARDNYEIDFDFDINATHKMLEVGAKKIYVCELKDDGSCEVVKTYSREEMPKLINTNSAFADGYVTFKGTPGVRYFATIALYAKDSDGNETLVFDTNVVTAKR